MKNFLLLSAVCLLSACGGGSGGNTATPQPEKVAIAPLKVKIVQALECGGTFPASNAEVLIYSNDWKIVSRHKADANGAVEVPVTSKLLNFSLLVNNGTAAVPNVFQQAFTQIESGNFGTVELGITAEGCECRTATALVNKVSSSVLNEISLTTNTGKSYHSVSRFNFDEAQFPVCRQVGAEWPVLTFSAIDANGEWFFDQLGKYDPSKRMVINFFRTTTKLAHVTNSPAVRVNTFSYGKHGMQLVGPYNSTVLFAAPELGSINFVGHTGRLADSQFIKDDTMLTYSSVHRVNRTTDFLKPVTFNVPELSEAKKFGEVVLKSLTTEEMLTNYDFSAFSDFKMFEFSINSSFNNGGKLAQSVFGPLKGVLPEDLLPAGYIDPQLDESIATFSLAAQLININSDLDTSAQVKQMLPAYTFVPGNVKRPAEFKTLEFYWDMF